MQTGFYPGTDAFVKNWQLERRFTPTMDEATREAKYAAWRDAVTRTLSQQE